MTLLRIAWECLLAWALHVTNASRRFFPYRTIVGTILHKLDMLRERAVRMLARYQATAGKLTRRQQRIGAAVGAVLLHLVLLFALLVGLRVTAPAAVHELDIAVGGPLGVETDVPHPPALITPDTPIVPPPVIEIADAVVSDTTLPAGSPNVTMPAQAIAEAHAFPPLPAVLKSKGQLIVRLVISVTDRGTIDNATVQGSSGISALDYLAVDWVKTHWRYRPALQNGRTVAVLTTAIVIFANT